MIEIDGSYGEGGGQILRTAVGLSVLTLQPVTIYNIRGNRSNPGIMPQHLTAVQCLKTLSNATTNGLEIGSSKLVFDPDILQPGSYTFDIGTAGSITLVLQAALIGAMETKEPITLRLKGGTDVKWSPTWDYFEHVFLPLIENMGVNVRAELLQRGFYPKGGGEARIHVFPQSNQVQPLRLDDSNDFANVRGHIPIAHLPDHIGQRIRQIAMSALQQHNFSANIGITRSKTASPGVSFTLWPESQGVILGSAVIGEKGYPSEKVGVDVAEQLIADVNCGATVDICAADQIIPYVARAADQGESSFFVRDVSNHTRTHLWLVKQFLDVDFLVKKKKSFYEINID